jgi:hypothetical protein
VRSLVLPDAEPKHLKRRGAYRRALMLARRFAEEAWILAEVPRADEDTRLVQHTTRDVTAAWAALEKSRVPGTVAALDVLRTIDLAAALVQQGRKRTDAVNAALGSLADDWPEYAGQVRLGTLVTAVNDWGAKRSSRWKSVLAVIEEAGILVRARTEARIGRNVKWLQQTWGRARRARVT